MITVYGITRGTQQVSYDLNQYRATIREGGQPVFISTAVLDLRGAVRDTDDLARNYTANRFGGAN